MATRTIPLTNRPPVRIDEDAWPVIARAETYSGERKCQANLIAWIRVRQHADGRAIVYGRVAAGPGGQLKTWTGEWVDGDLLAAGQDIAAAIRGLQGPMDRAQQGAIGGVDINALVRACIADLPAEDLA